MRNWLTQIGNSTPGIHTSVRLIALMTLIALWLFAVPDAVAQTTETCNTDLEYANGTTQEVITPVITEIQALLTNAYEQLYNGILNSSFPLAVQAAMTLYIALFGLMFMMGMIQLTVSEAFMRTLKLVIVATLIGPDSLTFFNDYVYPLFRTSTDELIYIFTSTMANAIDPAGGYVVQDVDPQSGNIPGPFVPLDAYFVKLFSPKTFAIFEAGTTSGPYGMIFLLVFMGSSFYLIGAIARSIWVYLVAILATTLLFGLAPIFISFMLFDRTKHLFQGWLSMLINFSIQPILLFSFLGFFAVLMDLAMEDILNIQVCYGEKGSIEGSPYSFRGWLYTDDSGTPISVRYTAQGPMCGDTPCADLDIFPMDIVDVLTFFLLAYTAWSFYDYIVQIANDISGAYITLEQGSPIQQAFQSANAAVDRGIGAALTGGNIGEAIMNSPGRTGPGGGTPSPWESGPGGGSYDVGDPSTMTDAERALAAAQAQLNKP